MGSLLLPVGARRMSSWTAHQHRSPRSTEPGTDFYCPIGTPVLSPWSGVVYTVSNSIEPATGRWVGVDLDNGQRFRTLHLSKTLARAGQRVSRGDILGLSGASGYGEEDWSWNPNTGGAHTHVTLWPTHRSRYGYHWVNGKEIPYTVDFMQYADTSSSAGGGESPEDDMTPEQANQLNQIYKAIFKGGPSMEENGNSISTSLAKLWNAVKPINRDGVQVAMRQEIADTKTTVIQLQASQAGLEEALRTVAGGMGLDPEVVLKAAQEGVERGLKNVTFTASVD